MNCRKNGLKWKPKLKLNAMNVRMNEEWKVVGYDEKCPSDEILSRLEREPPSAECPYNLLKKMKESLCGLALSALDNVF